MAYKSFTALSPRNQSSLVTQLHKLINYYGEIFSPRERSYIKSISQTPNSIYWLEDDDRKMVAVAIVDPNYVFNVDGIELCTLGYTISKRPGQMDRILSHIWADYEDKSMALLCRKTLAEVFNLAELNLIRISTLELAELWPNLANVKSDYFNVQRETLKDGMDRRQYNMYLKLTEADLKTLEKSNPALHDLVQKRKQEMKVEA